MSEVQTQQADTGTPALDDAAVLNAKFEELAELDRVTYDRCRDEEAKTLRIRVPFAGIEERREIVFAQAPGQPFWKSRGFHVGPHVNARHSTSFQVLPKRFESGQSTGDGASGEAPSGEMSEVSPDIILGDGFGPGSFASSFFHKALEIVQIPPVCVDGVRRVALGGVEVVEKNRHSRLHPDRITSYMTWSVPGGPLSTRIGSLQLSPWSLEITMKTSAASPASTSSSGSSFVTT